MRRTLIAATCMLVLALAGQANAKIMPNGQFVPDGLTYGDDVPAGFCDVGIDPW